MSDIVYCPPDVDCPCYARLTAEIEKLREEVKVWQGHTKTAVWSDSEECKMLTEDNERLRAALREPSGDVVDKAHAWDAIAAKNAEINRLRAALREIDSITVHSGGDIHGVHPSFWEVAFKQAQDTARDALGESDD